MTVSVSVSVSNSNSNSNREATTATSTSTSTSTSNNSQSTSRFNPPLRASRASRVIRAFDSKVFPTMATTKSNSSGDPAPKRRKVADVQAEIDAERNSSCRKAKSKYNANFHPPGSLFSRLTGLAAKRKREDEERIQRESILQDLGVGLGSAIGNDGKTRHGQDSSTSSTSSYNPFSLPSLQSRISTFTLSTYSPKPPSLSPLAAALAGWRNSSRECLTCSVCQSTCNVENWDPEQIRDAEKSAEGEGNGLTIVQQSFKNSHKEWCPWKVRSCSIALYRIPLLSSFATLSELASKAAALQPHVSSLEITSPLTEHEGQALTDSVNSANHQSTSTPGSFGPTTETLSPQSVLLALFGWELIPTSTSTTTYSSKSQALAICQMCQRKLGLWTFSSSSSTSKPMDETSSTNPPRKTPLDCEREHRTFCPLVNEQVQGGTWLNSDSSSSSIELGGNSGMRGRAGSNASSFDPQLGRNQNGTGISLGLSPHPKSNLLPGWKIRLNTALKSSTNQSNQNQFASGGSERSQVDRNVSLEKEMEMRREKSREMLDRVRKIVGGNP